LTPPSGNVPTVVTTAALLITSTGTTLNGTVNANGLSTTAHFEWGTTTAYGNVTAPADMSNTTQTLSLGATIGGLARNTIYHFRAVATNSAGTSNGADVAFATLP
jgi:hypothetical protein